MLPDTVRGETFSTTSFTLIRPALPHCLLIISRCPGPLRESKGGTEMGGGRERKHAPDTCNGMETSITYTVALATGWTLGPWQTSVSLLSLLTRWSDKADQTGVTLRSDKEKSKKKKKSCTPKKMQIFTDDEPRKSQSSRLAKRGGWIWIGSIV